MSFWACLVCGVTACQPVPTPFAHIPGAGEPIVSQKPDIAGVTVLPVTGLAKSRSDALSTAMVDAFMAMEIPAATTGANRHSRFVRGSAHILNKSPKQFDIRVEWTLTDSHGKTIEQQTTRHTVDAKTWKELNSKSLSPCVKTTARTFARRILGGRLELDSRNQTQLPALHVWPIDGIEDSKSAILKRAMERALESQKFAVLRGLDGASLIIAGSVSLGSERAGKQAIEINWSVLDAKGKQVGKLDQRNSVAISTLKDGWPTLSSIIAGNAAGGVSEIVNRLP